MLFIKKRRFLSSSFFSVEIFSFFLSISEKKIERTKKKEYCVINNISFFLQKNGTKWKKIYGKISYTIFSRFQNYKI